MKKEYWYIIIAYISMHLSNFIGVPAVYFIGTWMGGNPEKLEMLAGPYWLVISFVTALVVILFLLRKEWGLASRNAASWPMSFTWAFLGIFLALFSQYIAANIELLFGIEVGSDNTSNIMDMIEQFTLMILVSSIIGPILEEIVFRKIIFGSLHKRFNFLISALASSVIFASAHGEFEHIILYSAIGFTFAYLYVKTNRIIVPILTHVGMNTFAVVSQFLYREGLNKEVQAFIGGIFL